MFISLKPLFHPLQRPIRFGDAKPEWQTPESAAAQIAAMGKNEPKTLGNESSDIPLEGEGIAPQHGRVSRGVNGVLQFTPLTTQFPSSINGNPLQQGQTYPLYPRDRLTLGTSDVTLDIRDQDAEAQLHQFVQKGLEFLKFKQYQLASRHFHSLQATRLSERLNLASDLSYSYIKLKPIQDPSELDRISQMLAQVSYFAPRRLKIMNYDEAFRDKLRPEQKSLSEMAHTEAALAGADLWLRVQRFISGKRLVSDHPVPVDTAFYLHQENVPLTERFVQQLGRQHYQSYLLGKTTSE